MATNGLTRNKQEELAFLTKYLASLEADLGKPEYALPGYQKELLSRIAATKVRIAEVEAALAAARNEAAIPTASSADTAANAQVARDDAANPAAPAPPVQKVIAADGRVADRGTTSETNATRTPTSETGAKDTGTDATLRTTTVSQSISSPPASGPLKDIPAAGAFVPGEQAQSLIRTTASGETVVDRPTNNAKQRGIAAGNDDTAQKPGSSLQNSLDNLYGTNNIVARENVLDQYPSYTYSLSWYLLDPDTYKTLFTQSARSLTGFYLLAQSGGANVQNAIPTYQGPSYGAGRNPSFPLDYYIDDFYVDFYYPGTPGARGSSAISEIGFTVTEPNGITLLRNLYAAIRDLYVSKGRVKPDATINYSSAHFCMVIRFYGYDANGNLIMPIGSGTGLTDKSAVIEKYIPFNIVNVDFKVSNKLVEYAIKCASPGQNHNASTNRGTVPKNFTFNGATVQEMLVGSVEQRPVVTADEGRAGGDGTWSA